MSEHHLQRRESARKAKRPRNPTTLWPATPLPHVKKRRSFSACLAERPTAIQLPFGAPCGRPTWPHAPSRPGSRPWLRVPSASSRECLRLPKPLGPGAAAAGALSHSGAGGGTLRCFNSLWTRMHRRSLGFASSGREMSKSLPSAFRAGRARSLPAAAFAHRPLEGSLRCARRCWALSFNPGALEARYGCGARTQKVRARRLR